MAQGEGAKEKEVRSHNTGLETKATLACGRQSSPDPDGPASPRATGAGSAHRARHPTQLELVGKPRQPYSRRDLLRGLVWHDTSSGAGKKNLLLLCTGPRGVSGCP